MIAPIVIERKKLFEQVAEHLEAQIISGELQPGDLLPPERDLQVSFGVGRPAIREALITLQKAGLVELTNGARARVQTPTAEHIFTGMTPAVRHLLSTGEGQRAFQSARRFFEVGLARNAASNATDEELRDLKAALDANKAAIGDNRAFIATDIAFHFELAKIAHNVIFLALHDQISEWLREQRVVTLTAENQEQIAYAAHKAIYEAVAARNPNAAEAAMTDHLNQLSSTFWRQKEGEQSE